MAVSSNSIKVASVTVMAMIQGFTADRSAATLGKRREAVVEPIIGANASFDATRDRSVASEEMV